MTKSLKICNITETTPGTDTSGTCIAVNQQVGTYRSPNLIYPNQSTLFSGNNTGDNRFIIGDVRIYTPQYTNQHIKEPVTFEVVNNGNWEFEDFKLNILGLEKPLFLKPNKSAKFLVDPDFICLQPLVTVIDYYTNVPKPFVDEPPYQCVFEHTFTKG